MQTHRELRSFSIFAVFWLSVMYRLAIERIIEALYFHGPWFRVQFWTVGSLVLTLVLVVGWRAVRDTEKRTDGTEAPLLKPTAEKWGLISAYLGFLIATSGIWGWIERLGQPQVAIGFKGILTLLIALTCVFALLQFREARFKFRLAQRQASMRISAGCNEGE
jgi:hypothetical protein